MPRLVHKYSLQHYSELPKTGEGLNFHSLVNGQNVYIHSGILFSTKEEWTPSTGYNMAEPCKHYITWKEAKHKRWLIGDLIYTKLPEKAKVEI